MTSTDLLIDQLADSATPVRPVRERAGRLGALGAAIVTIVAVIGLYGLRPQLFGATGDSMTWVLLGLLALLALAAGSTAIRMAQPAVGASGGGAPWLLGAVLVFPGIALIETLAGRGDGTEPALGIECLSYGIAASLLTAVVLVTHLRRGAPVLPHRAGLLAGLAAGAVGSFAITLECAGTTFAHLAFWHVAIVVAWAAAGRTVLGRLLRW